jgi:inorganic pyrophosphatase
MPQIASERAARLSEIDPGRQSPSVVRMIVEIPKNSANKYEYDAELGVFKLDRPLYSPVHYPADYGFVPGTISEDGDPIDILSLAEEPGFPGCLIEVRPLGILDMVDDSESDRKILAVPARDPHFDQICDVDGLPDHQRKEIEHFFQIYKILEGKTVQTHGWHGREDALEHITAARKRFLSRSNRHA